MARLIVREGPGRGTAYDLMEDSITIGRDPSNVIQVPSETVSRSHAVLNRSVGEQGESWEIQDLRSKNGVLVNGRRIAQATLNSGDEIRLGETAWTFIERDFDALESRDMTDSGEALMMRDVLRSEMLAARPAVASPTVVTGSESRKRLLALLELGHLAGSAKSYPELFEAITAAIERNLEPHRTVPILFDERKGLLRPWVSQRGEFDRHLAKIPISSTIVNYVRENRAAILSETAQKDDRLRAAPSITAHQITSAMCAPIQIGDRLLGAIYVDRLGDADRFAKDDLELLTAFAVQAAVAVENVRMRVEMGHERYVREKEARGEYDIVGQCDAMRKLFRFISRAAPTDAGVLIEGESGTGKELVARAIHLNSRRRHQPFEAVNCAAMAPALLESELFGHVRGAFTGADRERPGRFELADGGTLFLDEIGELPESSQSKLLRTIETGELRRVGDVKDRQVNVRVLAATNKKLADEISTGRFREDLYFRLNVLKVSLPPLRERGADVRVLAQQFLKHFAEKCGRSRLRFDER
ncbi:MAG: sigma 54-interacting transcriptional regulator, partial [Pseudomonadota bacterium]